MRTVNDALNWAKDQLGVSNPPLPQSWCPDSPNNDCCYFATDAVGSTVGNRLDIRNGSIQAFRADRKWPEGKAAKVGALVLLRWESSGDPDHIGIVHTVYPDGSVGTYEANTGPSVGVFDPIGRYSRRRYPANIVGYVYPPYASAAAPAKHVGKTYKVKDGDTLTAIAKSNKTTIPAILKVNPKITNPDIISAGQIINLP